MIYGAAGPIGAALARGFARHGAQVFVASDLAASITSTEINISCGATVD